MAAATPNMSRAAVTRRRACGASQLVRPSRQSRRLNDPRPPATLAENGERTIKQLRIGDITIDAVIEREGPWRRPQDFFPAYDDSVFRHHLPTMEPEVFD